MGKYWSKIAPHEPFSFFLNYIWYFWWDMPASSKTSKIGYYWIPISHNRIKIGWKRVLEGVQKWPNIVWKYYFHTKLSDLNLFLVCFMISATKWLHCNHLTPIIFHCATVVVTINDPFFWKKNHTKQKNIHNSVKMYDLLMK